MGDYWSTSEGQGVIYAIVAVGIVLVLALVLGLVGWWCYRKGKFSKLPELFAARPVWTLQPRVAPKPITIQTADDDGGNVTPITSGGDSGGHHPAVMGNGGPAGVVIHHYESGKPKGKKRTPPPPPALPQMMNTPARGSIPAVSNGQMITAPPPGPFQQPMMTHPDYVPPITGGAPIARPFMGFDVDPSLTAPYDNVLTDHLLRFATGSAKQVARNTNLKSVLILNKQRRENGLDTLEGGGEDWDSADEEMEERAAHDFTAVGGDEVEVDSRHGRILIDQNDELHVYALDKPDKMLPRKEIL